MLGKRWTNIVLVLALLTGLFPALLSAPGPVMAAGEAFRGELNSWGSWTMSSSLGGTFIHTTGQITAVNDSNSEFKYFQDSNLWYGKDSPNTVTFGAIFTGLSTGGGDERNLRFNHVQNRYYVFKWNGSDKGVIFQLSNAPASITHVSQTPTAPTNADPVTINITLSAAMPGEQAVWLRYTTDTWGSSTVVKMTGSGTAYSATIPAQSNGVTVVYYVFTSGNVATITGSDADLMTITYNTNGGSNYSYTVGAGPVNPISDVQALWLSARIMAWNGTTSGVTQYRLLFDPDGAVSTVYGGSVCPATPTGPCYVSLTANGTITINQFPKNPNANGLTRLDLPGAGSLSDDTIKLLLRGQVVVAGYNSSNALVDVSRVQIQSVLDALYAASAKPQTLGVSYSGGVPTVRVWAPTAKSVTLRRYADSTTPSYTAHAMTLDTASGVWTATGIAGWDRQFYLFDVEVYVPSVDAVLHNLVTDPYAVSLSTDSERSQFVNLADSDLLPTGWASLAKPELEAFEDITIYEMHVRDFSINDNTVAQADRGTFMAFTYDGQNGRTLSAGMAHLLALQDAGLTHVHLLPVFDIATVPEASVPRTVSPNPTGYARDSDQQQSIVGAQRADDGFNWGYDPYHFGVPEGSYSTDPDGVQRILEFRQMVQALNENGLRVVMDVVYNHTSASGQYDKSVFDKIVPGYYYRYDTNGVLQQSSCCPDTACEYEMMEKLILDTLVRFAEDYKVDGFRFDLMNLHTRRTMLAVQDALAAVDPEIYLYGEGWDFGSALGKGLTDCTNGWCYAHKYNMTGMGIGLFNDIIRDAAHGGYEQDSLQIRRQGFSNGLSYDWNGYEYANRSQSDLHNAMDTLRSALRGSGNDWNGQGAPFTTDPQESVPYISKHDNETLFDQNVFKLPNGNGSGNPGWIGSGIPTTSIGDRVRTQNVGLSLMALAQGVPFFHAASDILRSKSLDRNTYDSGDWFNRIYWDYSHNNFGQGLPPAWDNSSRWPIMSPLLANTALDPATSDMEFAAGQFREYLRIRYSSPLFRLRTRDDINARTSHYNTANTHDGLLILHLSDGPSPDLDPNLETLLVFFNANKSTQTYTVPNAAGLNFTLHPVHTDGVDDDPVITSNATFNNSTGAFTIPARTTVVFVSTQLIQPPSTLDWVGKMWPRGGVANLFYEDAVPAGGLDVYVQVYEAGVTPGAGQGAGIACYVHWGQYGDPWDDIPMTYNASIGDNDEYRATLPQAAIAAPGSGTQGFTTYCQKSGEGPKWKVDEYNIDAPGDDDQGDGLITLIPAEDLFPAPPGGVFVHLFEWRWADVEQECAYLADKGYTAVQVSPPNEHIVPTADQGGDPNSDYPWWARYQPVTHLTSTLTSRSGTLTEFQSMVDTCNALGVGVYVDAVINHTAYVEVGNPPAGTAGSLYENGFGNPAARFYGDQYQADDFHTDCDITSYSDRYQVQTCKLSGLPDLHTGREATREKLSAYLQALLDMGVAGFRIDAAKHIAAHELGAMLGLRGDFYVFHEVIDQGAERVRDWEYTPYGDVTEFAYPYALGYAFDDGCAGNLSGLENFTNGMLDSRFAVVFTDNHDNQRGHGVQPGQCIVDHRDGQEHVLANIFVLAYPYGHPSVVSSYYWQSDPTNDSGDSMGPPTVNGGPGSSGATLPVYVNGEPVNCASSYSWGKWACEHRRPETANMVRFRQVTEGTPVTGWVNVSSDHIAFGRGDKGFVAINRTGSQATTTYQTGLPAGTYCDVTQGELLPDASGCTGRVVTVNSSGQIVGYTLGAMDAFAIHTAARTGVVLTIATAGTGNGVVTPTVGSHVYDIGTVVTLTAVPHPGSIFTGWSGDPDCADGSVTMDASKTCTATFVLDAPLFTLTMRVDGAGSGVISPTVGVHAYPEPRWITLRAQPHPGSIFAGWSGGLESAQNPVTIWFETPLVITATFTLLDQIVYLPAVLRNYTPTLQAHSWRAR